MVRNLFENAYNWNHSQFVLLTNCFNNVNFWPRGYHVDAYVDENFFKTPGPRTARSETGTGCFGGTFGVLILHPERPVPSAKLTQRKCNQGPFRFQNGPFQLKNLRRFEGPRTGRSDFGTGRSGRWAKNPINRPQILSFLHTSHSHSLFSFVLSFIPLLLSEDQEELRGWGSAPVLVPILV